MAAALLFAAFGSEAAELTLAVFVIVVPTGVAALTCTTRVKVAVADTMSELFVDVTFPVAPTAGVVLIQPAGAVNETNVVLAGIASVSETLVASLGPLFVTLIV